MPKQKNPSPNETLCQFSDTFVQDGGRHLISAYHSKNVPASHTLLDQLPIPVQTSTFHVTHRPSHKIDLDAWHVGFGRSGEPLKGSAWKTSKWKDCYSLVYHEEPARTATVHHAPLSENDMQQIFNQEWKLGSQKAPPPPPPQQQQAVPKGTSSKSNQLNNKPNKSSAKNKIHGRKATNSKHGVEKLEPTVAPLAAAKQSVHQGAKRSKATGAKHQKQTKARTTTQQHLLTTQASLPQSEERSDGIEQQRRANDVGFDVLLAQTEQLLAQAAALPATVAASLVPDDEPAVVEYSHRDPTAPPTHRSTFILLDSGGWQEVVLDEQPESHEPVRQEDDISA